MPGTRRSAQQGEAVGSSAPTRAERRSGARRARLVVVPHHRGNGRCRARHLGSPQLPDARTGVAIGVGSVNLLWQMFAAGTSTTSDSGRSTARRVSRISAPRATDRSHPVLGTGRCRCIGATAVSIVAPNGTLACDWGIRVDDSQRVVRVVLALWASVGVAVLGPIAELVLGVPSMLVSFIGVAGCVVCGFFLSLKATGDVLRSERPKSLGSTARVMFLDRHAQFGSLILGTVFERHAIRAGWHGRRWRVALLVYLVAIIAIIAIDAMWVTPSLNSRL